MKAQILIAIALFGLSTGTAVLAADECQVHCKEPHAACEESQKVIDALHQQTRLLSRGDFKGLAEMMDEHVTTFDDNNKKLISGRDAVIADMKSRYEKSLALSEGGTVTYTIDRPYARVSGDYCTVTFVLHKKVSGKVNVAYESHSTDVFVKEDGHWKKLHYRGAFKQLKG